MNREEFPLARASLLWLLGALALAVAPQLLRLPVWLGGFGALVIAWRAAREIQGWPLPGRWLRLALTLGVSAAVLLNYRTLFGREAGVALLTVMLCLKLLELRSLRDAMVILFIAYFLVVSGFLYSQSIFVGGYMFVVVLALTGALVALNHPCASLARSPAYLRSAGALLLQALPMMALLFVLFPRISGPLWGLPKDAFSGRTGLSEQMSIGSITNLVDSEEVAFRVQFDGPVPPADRLYWRGPVLWRTDGRRWTPLHPEEIRAFLPYRPAFDIVEPKFSDYTVTLEPHDRHWLFAIDLPRRKPPEAVLSPGFQLLSRDKVTQRLRYRVRSATAYRTRDQYPGLRELALELPPGVNPRTLALGRQWREAGLDARARVQHALALFREQPFFYSRQPPPLGADPIDQFLFGTRRGFCEHYAAAFTTLMRAAGVPARVVTGYQGGEKNPVGDYLLVRQSNAHAWAEVHLAGAGWVRVDPTAVIPPERVETSLDAERFRSTAPAPLSDRQLAWLAQVWRGARQNWDALNHAWNQWVLGYDRAAQSELMRNLGLDRYGWRGLLILLFALLAALFALVALWLFWRRGPAPDPALQLYLRFCTRLARRGLARGAGEGPLDFARRVAAARPDLAGQASLITGLYIHLRYAGAAPEPWLARLRRQVMRFRP